MSVGDDDDGGGGRRRRYTTAFGSDGEHANLDDTSAESDLSHRNNYGSVAAATPAIIVRNEAGDDEETAPMLPPPSRHGGAKLDRRGDDDDGRPRGSWQRWMEGRRKRRQRASSAPLGLLAAVLLVAAVSAPRTRRTLLDLASSLGGGGEERRMRIASFDAQLALSELQALADSASFEPAGKKKKKKKDTKRNEKETRPPPDGCEGTVLIVRHCEKDTLEEHCDYVGFERAHYLPHLFGVADGSLVQNRTTENDDLRHRGGKRPKDKEAPSGAEAVEGARRRKEDHGEGRGESFGDYIRPRWPAPSYLFALSPQRHSNHHKNYREIETIQPLADKFHLPINSDYPSSRMSSLTNHVFRSLHSGDMCGKLTVISWKHSEIPALAQRLGCGPIQGCPMDYSSMEFDAVWQLKFVFDVGRYGLPPPAGSGARRRAKEEEVSKKAKNRNKKQKQMLQGQPPPQPPRWKVFGSVQREGFDPLEFSARAGDYPRGGTARGGRWIDVGDVKSQPSR